MKNPSKTLESWKLAFNGMNTNMMDKTIHICPNSWIKNISPTSMQKVFDNQRAFAHYISVAWRLDLCVPTGLIAVGNQLSSEVDHKTRKKLAELLKTNDHRVLGYTKS